LTGSGATVTANTVVLASNAGSVGTSALNLSVNTSNLTAQALGANVFVSDTSTGNVNLVNTTIGSAAYTNTVSSTGSYSVTATNAGSSTSLQTASDVAVSANNIYLTSTAGALSLAGSLTSSG